MSRVLLGLLGLGLVLALLATPAGADPVVGVGSATGARPAPYPVQRYGAVRHHGQGYAFCGPQCGTPYPFHRPYHANRPYICQPPHHYRTCYTYGLGRRYYARTGYHRGRTFYSSGRSGRVYYGGHRGGAARVGGTR